MSEVSRWAWPDRDLRDSNLVLVLGVRTDLEFATEGAVHGATDGDSRRVGGSQRSVYACMNIFYAICIDEYNFKKVYAAQELGNS